MIKSLKLKVWPQWNAIHLFLYNFIPGLIMIVFNFLLIYTTLMPSRSTANKNVRRPSATDLRDKKKKKKLTISLVVVTTAFVVLTFPSTICWGYLSDIFYTWPYGVMVLNILDYFSFANHASLFFFTFISNYKFRRVIYYYFKRIFCCLDSQSEGSFSTQNVRSLNRVTN